jgi:hypothetical protein
VEHHAFVKTLLSQEDKVVHGLGSFICEQLDYHGAFVGLHVRFVFLLGIDLHLRWFRPLFCHTSLLLFFLAERRDEMQSASIPQTQRRANCDLLFP